MFYLTRRIFAASALAVAALFAVTITSAGAQNIVIGIPAAQSGPVGVADHQDWTNGVMMAIEEVNASGGVLGR